MSMIGKSLLHYEISAQIGRGGMGEVYQAKDKKLGRDVAIKILPEEFARDADRVARFQREAKLLASLNHPNIAAIHGLEESDGTNFLVMELIEGDTLADRIKTGPIPVEEALKLALQIAEALEAAHEKGVIHRDLKPANIKITPEGKIKILDFGLAKAFAEDQGEEKPLDSPTLSDAATRQGIILGTAAYMSPEQARGKPVDKRADIWAFGVILFEMLTGRALFKGEDTTSTLARVLEREPDYSALTPNLHPRIRFLLERCLEKDPGNRYNSIIETRIEIQKVLSDPGGVLVQPITGFEPQKRTRITPIWVAAIVILTAIIVGVVIWNLKPTKPLQINRFEYDIPEIQQLSNLRFNLLAVSPDGRQIVYCTYDGIYIRSIDELEARLISGTENSVNPFFSPDSQWIGFYSMADGILKKIPIIGGAAVPLCDAFYLLGAAWNTDGTIVYSEYGKGIQRVSENGSTPELLVKQEPFLFTSPQLLPDGKTLLFHHAVSDKETHIVVQSIESGERTVLFPGAKPRYVSTGHIIYVVENNLFAVSFDANTLKVIGSPVSIVQGILRHTQGSSPHYATSDGGTLVYMPGQMGTPVYAKRTLVWVDLHGKATPLTAESGDYRDLKLSPDGKGVALTRNKDSNTDIWIWDLLRNNMRRLTFNEGEDTNPLWTLDSQKIIFQLHDEGVSHIYSKAANGTGELEEIVSTSDRGLIPWSWSGDGNTLVLSELLLNPFSTDIGLLAMDGENSLKPLLSDKKYNESDPQVSPDGRWLAYHSDESGKFEIYVCAFPELVKGKWQVSVNGGISPRWSPDGERLYYWKDNSLIAIDVETEATFNPGNEEILFEGDYLILSPSIPLIRVPWDVHPDGNKFLMLKDEETADNEVTTKTPLKLVIVTNWFEDLKVRVPAD